MPDRVRRREEDWIRELAGRLRIDQIAPNPYRQSAGISLHHTARVAERPTD
jgi:hypothetical protein